MKNSKTLVKNYESQDVKKETYDKILMFIGEGKTDTEIKSILKEKKHALYMNDMFEKSHIDSLIDMCQKGESYENVRTIIRENVRLKLIKDGVLEATDVKDDPIYFISDETVKDSTGETISSQPVKEVEAVIIDMVPDKIVAKLRKILVEIKKSKDYLSLRNLMKTKIDIFIEKADTILNKNSSIIEEVYNCLSNNGNIVFKDTPTIETTVKDFDFDMSNIYSLLDEITMFISNNFSNNSNFEKIKEASIEISELLSVSLIELTFIMISAGKMNDYFKEEVKEKGEEVVKEEVKEKGEKSNDNIEVDPRIPAWVWDKYPKDTYFHESSIINLQRMDALGLFD